MCACLWSVCKRMWECVCLYELMLQLCTSLHGPAISPNHTVRKRKQEKKRNGTGTNYKENSLPHLNHTLTSEMLSHCIWTQTQNVYKSWMRQSVRRVIPSTPQTIWFCREKERSLLPTFHFWFLRFFLLGTLLFRLASRGDSESIILF